MSSYADPALRTYDIERLAALIRKVDGAHELGAGALAEALVDEGCRPPVQAGTTDVDH